MSATAKILADINVTFKAVMAVLELMIGVPMPAGYGESDSAVAVGPIIDRYKNPTLAANAVRNGQPISKKAVST